MRILIKFVPITIIIILIKSVFQFFTEIQISSELIYVFVIRFIVFVVMFIVSEYFKKKKIEIIK